MKKIRKLSIGYKLMEKIRTSPPIESWINKGKTGGTPELRPARFFLKKFRKILFLSQNFVQRGNDVVDVFDAD